MFPALRPSAVALLLGYALCASAQSSSTVSGTVLDSTGAIIPGATVRIVHDEGGIAGTAVSDSAGRFIMMGVDTGNYRLEVAEFAGFRSLAMRLHLKKPIAGLNLVLLPQSVSELVNVRDDVAGLGTDPSANVDTISASADQLRQLQYSTRIW